MYSSIAVIGGTKAQLPIVQLCLEFGFEPVVIDRDSNCFLRKYASEFIHLDFGSFKEVHALSKVREFKFAMTHQSDSGVIASAFLNEVAGIETLSVDSAKLVSNKILMREALSGLVFQPRYRVFSSMPSLEEVREFGFPSIIKIVNSSGSRGVRKILNLSDFDLYSIENNNKKDSQFILEEYISGVEFGVQTLHLMGNLKYLIPHNDKLKEGPTPVPIGHSLPFRYPHLKRELDPICDVISKKLGFNSNAGNFDFILSEEGDIYFIEVGGRMGATGIPKMIKYYNGVDILRELFSFLAEQTPVQKNDFIEEDNCVATEILKSSVAGSIKSVPKVQIDKSSTGLIEVEFSKQKGDQAKVFQTGNDKLGEIFVRQSILQRAEDLAAYYVEKIESEFEYGGVNS
jgi:biotin carboxylase